MATRRAAKPARRPAPESKRAALGRVCASEGVYAGPAIQQVDGDRPIRPVGAVRDHGAILAMSFSPDGALLATLSTVGQTKLWGVPQATADGDDEWRHVATLRDSEETAVEECYCCEWLEGPDALFLAVGGKRKDRHCWSDSDDDNHVLPGVIKIFNMSGEVVQRLEGHEEELLYLKAIRYGGTNYLLSGSQDGYIMIWTFSNDWRQMLHVGRMADGESCMVFSMEPLPGSGNRLILAACDDMLRLFDMEDRKCIQAFSSGYSAYCDHAIFVDPTALTSADGAVPSKSVSTAPTAAAAASTAASDCWYIAARGVELLDVDTLTPMAGNSIKLFRLSQARGKFVMEELLSLADEEYLANSWLMKLAVSGNSVFVPTVNGELFVLDLSHGVGGTFRDRVTARIKHHDPVEVRQTLLHPSLPYLLTCADDGMVKIYRQ